MLDAARSFTGGLMDILFYAGSFVVPWILLHIVVRIFKFTHRSTRRESFEDLENDFYAERENYLALRGRMRRSSRRNRSS